MIRLDDLEVGDCIYDFVKSYRKGLWLLKYRVPWYHVFRDANIEFLGVCVYFFFKSLDLRKRNRVILLDTPSSLSDQAILESMVKMMRLQERAERMFNLNLFVIQRINR